MHTPRRPGPPPGLREVRRAHELLGVGDDADAPALARAYRRLARRHHPDLSTDPEAAERFRALHAAYQLALDSLLHGPLPMPRRRREPVHPEPAAPPRRAADEAARWVTDLDPRRDDGVWLVAGPVRIHHAPASGARSTSQGGPR